MQTSHLLREAPVTILWVNDHYFPPPENSSHIIWYYARSFSRHCTSLLYESDREDIHSVLTVAFYGGAVPPPPASKDAALALYCLEQVLGYFIKYYINLGTTDRYARPLMRLQQATKGLSLVPEEVVKDHLAEIEVSLGLLSEEQLVSEIEHKMTIEGLGARGMVEATQFELRSFIEVVVHLTKCVAHGVYAEAGALTLLIHFRFGSVAPLRFFHELLHRSGYHHGQE